MTSPAKGICSKCKAEGGSQERMNAEGNHHKRSCSLFRPFLLVNCKNCGVAGSPAWIMTSGRHHGWSCPRYAYVDAGECKYCGYVGEASMVTSAGPHHAARCQRFGPSRADSPKATVCKYCGFRGTAEMVTGMGDQHLATCPRSAQRAKVAAKAKEAKAKSEGTGPGWFACLTCCGVEEVDGVPSEVAVAKPPADLGPETDEQEEAEA
ncbi:unnamed protein product [Effrenium voratum]|uniref:Uncharacterized protein n=1 Tax=Effrenium voratum TaxID=2562239 RepID=A0AA36JL08_9DINO|nr:unnamed protein product [Effrenium voratum]CAJ1458091.1 unnamed protein product [Effrenium voratum]